MLLPSGLPRLLRDLNISLTRDSIMVRRFRFATAPTPGDAITISKPS
jgi:hypothetical protein